MKRGNNNKMSIKVYMNIFETSKGRLFMYAFKCLLTVLSVITSLYYTCITVVVLCVT